MSDASAAIPIGQRVVVTGSAGAGKSTLSKALAAKTGLPVVHLDLYLWSPGWVRAPEDAFLAKQHELARGERWIVDSNDACALWYERADTLVWLDLPWWTCAWRAFLRGVRPRPKGTRLPEGCEDDPWQRLTDEWGIVGRTLRRRSAIREPGLADVARYGETLDVHVLRSPAEADAFVRRASVETVGARA